jgi:1-phosphofructokinase/6-phosphofructokinase 2
VIVTLTPNPSIDRAIVIDALHRGEVHRATSSRVDPGGKGVNVSRALAAQGTPTIAVLPAGGPEGHLMEELLDAAGVARRSVAVAGALRMNISVLEPDGTTTKLNERGPTLSATELDALIRTVLDCASPDTWIVGCGSLPVGVPVEFFADLVAPLRARGAHVVVDTSDDALRAVLTTAPGRALPDLVKPNREELTDAVGHPLHTFGDVVDAARVVIGRGVGTVLASLGADGAVLVDAAGAAHAEAHIDRPRSTVGAGDALLAGFLSRYVPDATPDAARAALATAVAWGAAATSLPGSRMPGPDDVAAIAVTLHDDLDLRRTLKGDHQ